MAQVALTVTIVHALPNGAYSLSTGTVAAAAGGAANLATHSASLTADVGTIPATTTVAANIATLVADGATPTQGHVNTLNTNWGTYLTALNANNALLVTDAANIAIDSTSITGSSGANVTLSYDTTAVTSMNQLRAALRAFEHLCQSRLTA